MSDRLLKESDVLRIAFQLPLVINSAFANAVKALPSADRPQEWILCSEKLPEEFVDVLVCLTDGAMYVAQLTDYIDIWGEPKWCTDISHHCISGAILSSDIVAWMPLPKSYKGN